MALFYEWYEVTRDERGRERRRKLRWRLTIPDLIARGLRPEHLGKVFEMVPNSEERRHEGEASYGQFLQLGDGKDVVIHAAGQFAARGWMPKEPGT